jgi:hypothetical protein
LVGDVFGFIEEIGVESLVGVEDFDADEAAVFPVERDETGDARWVGGLDGVAAGLERLVGEVDVGRVGGAVVGDPHGLILRARSATSCR